MEPNNSIGEGARWLSIAEKLLPARDLIGSKTFAIRARESDPKLELAEQILAIADTLIAGEIRINNQHDWYAVLQLSRLTREAEIVASQYRRLALLLHPHKNKLPFADQALKLVLDAWAVLSHPAKKEIYDNELRLHDLAGVSVTQSQKQHQHQQPFWKTPPRNPVQPVQSTLPDSNESRTVPSFWTACPYCFNLYEYPRVYEECTLRCQNCRRAFHAVTVPEPPTGGESGKDDYFCCWGYFPLGFLSIEYQKAKGNDKMGPGNWTPFSPMFACPVPPSSVGRTPVKAKTKSVAKPKAIIIDDDGQVLMDVSEPSEDSDSDWQSSKTKKKKVKTAKGKSSAIKAGKKAAQAERVRKGNQNVMEQVFGAGFESIHAGPLMAEDLVVEKSTIGELSSKKVVGSSSTRPMEKNGNDLGKLDLNVEFSNEGEEPARRMHAGNRTGTGEEDNIEGIGFFEGLDEFLSSLPILSVVGDVEICALMFELTLFSTSVRCSKRFWVMRGQKQFET